MNWIEAIILGVIQGLTEFLPVSSSGHLELGSAILGVASSENLLFAVVVHFATALSTIVVFRKDILGILAGIFKFQWNEEWQFAIKIAISMVPVGIVGVFYGDEVEAFFGGNILLVGSMLLVTSSLLFFTYFSKKNEGDVSFGKSLIIGISQAIAILPGISRSGATISTALLLGIDKERAARFSFLMVLIPIMGAAALKLKDYFEAPPAADGIGVTALTLGFIAAFISGFIACKWMIGIVKKGKLIYFAIYCAIVGTIAVGFALWS